ncbi:MAG: DeoR/GlpR family DNA-binding transcription regulator [Terrisporobacter sp.]
MEAVNILAEERYAKILDKLKNDGIVKNNELKKLLNASSETIRKDLKFLEEAGQLDRVHGGAIPKNNKESIIQQKDDNYISFDVRQYQNSEMKHSIAMAAAELIKDGQSIGLDSGTTSYELAKVLKEKFNNLTIVTNSLVNAHELVEKEGFTVIATGGILTCDEKSFISDFATLILEKINLDIMFLTTCGVSLENGITDQRMAEVTIHSKMMDCSKKVVVLSDSTKFNEISLFKVCPLEKVECIVTDSNIDNRLVNEFRKEGHNIIVSS